MGLSVSGAVYILHQRCATGLIALALIALALIALALIALAPIALALIALALLALRPSLIVRASLLNALR